MKFFISFEYKQMTRSFEHGIIVYKKNCRGGLR